MTVYASPCKAAADSPAHDPLALLPAAQRSAVPVEPCPGVLRRGAGGVMHWRSNWPPAEPTALRWLLIVALGVAATVLWILVIRS